MLNESRGWELSVSSIVPEGASRLIDSYQARLFRKPNAQPCGCVRGEQLCDAAVTLWNATALTYHAAQLSGDYSTYEQARVAYDQHFAQRQPMTRDEIAADNVTDDEMSAAADLLDNYATIYAEAESRGGVLKTVIDEQAFTPYARAERLIEEATPDQEDTGCTCQNCGRSVSLDATGCDGCHWEFDEPTMAGEVTGYDLDDHGPTFW
jgi:hypothetical protein